ncbi:hypothetical protein B0I18_11424 [Taibaiella chishuiensis]|uniref:Nucleoside-triphosphatase THEP1 n=2 Tax=Taibaiella chishuiensis TaxID=1434707 RepID=A0A2P8CV17_9BACT|nr:hypothetical protein B0I18_11424 [Taibaiella chishuiensis]
MMKEKKGQIYLFSRAIRTGKTTALYNWVQDRPGAAGILTPDVHNRRVIYDIATKRYHTFEVADSYGGEKITIGRFLFAKEAFARARDILAAAVAQHPAWLVIDEAGKLELEQGEGLEPAILNTVRSYQSGQQDGQLLIVVRDSLLPQAINRYGLQDAIVLSEHLP